MPLLFAPDIPRSLRKFAEAEAARLGLHDWHIEISFALGSDLDRDHGGGDILKAMRPSKCRGSTEA